MNDCSVSHTGVKMCKCLLHTVIRFSVARAVNTVNMFCESKHWNKIFTGTSNNGSVFGGGRETTKCLSPTVYPTEK